MEFKIRETGEIKEVCYVAEVEDLLPALVESDDDAKFTGEDVRYEISQNGFDWWKEWADKMTAATKRYYDITGEDKIHYPLPDEFIANEIEDEPSMLDSFCDALEDGKWEWAEASSDPWSEFSWVEK